MKIKYSPFVFIILVVILGFLGNSYLQNKSSVSNSANPKPVKSVREVIAERKTNAKFENVKFKG